MAKKTEKKTEKADTKKKEPAPKCKCEREQCDCRHGHACDDVSLLERLMDDDNDDNIILFDNDGKEIEVEQVAAVNHENEVYAVLHIVGDPEEEVLVFRIDPKDEESIIIVEDEKLANKILQIVMDESNK